MAAPVLQPEAVSITIHLPNATASWYHLQGGEPLAAPGESLTLLAPENELILLIRGGHIIALQVCHERNFFPALLVLPALILTSANHKSPFLPLFLRIKNGHSSVLCHFTNSYSFMVGK